MNLGSRCLLLISLLVALPITAPAGSKDTIRKDLQSQPGLVEAQFLYQKASFPQCARRSDSLDRRTAGRNTTPCRRAMQRVRTRRPTAANARMAPPGRSVVRCLRVAGELSSGGQTRASNESDAYSP